jgi:hypothetical protein
MDRRITEELILKNMMGLWGERQRNTLYALELYSTLYIMRTYGNMEMQVHAG